MGFSPRCARSQYSRGFFFTFHLAFRTLNIDNETRMPVSSETVKKLISNGTPYPRECGYDLVRYARTNHCPWHTTSFSGSSEFPTYHLIVKEQFTSFLCQLL